MRVVFFLETPHRLAGAQRSLMTALTRIAAHGVDPLVVFPGTGIVEETYRAAGIPTRVVVAPPSLLLFNKRVLQLNAVERARLLATEHVPYTRTLAKLFRAERAAAVHFNTARGILIGGVAARLAGKPTLLHLRGAPGGFGRSLWLAAQALADRIVMVARSLEPTLSTPFRRRGRVVYNGVVEQPARDRMASRRALAERIGAPELAGSDVPLFVSLSSLTAFKGLHHLLTAAARLRDRGIDAHYVLAGGDSDREYVTFLMRRRAELDLEAIVHVLGFVPDPLTVLAGGDVAVLPSVEREHLMIDGTLHDVVCAEGLPRTILEALSLGVPVVATRVQGVVEQIDEGRTGLIVPPSDPDALADALERAAMDPGWREAAGADGVATARSRFSLDAAAAGLARVLREVAR